MGKARSAFGRARGGKPIHAGSGVQEGGQFISRSTALHAVVEALSGGGGKPKAPDKPATPDKAAHLRGLTRRRLLAAARGHGLSPRRGKSDEDVISAIVARTRGDAPSPGHSDGGGGRHRQPEQHVLPEVPPAPNSGPAARARRAASRPAPRTAQINGELRDLDELETRSGLAGRSPTELRTIAHEANIELPSAARGAPARRLHLIRAAMEHDRRTRGDMSNGGEGGIRHLREAVDRLDNNNGSVRHAPSARGRREAGRVLGPPPTPASSGETMRHVGVLENLGSRGQAETYLRGVRGQALTDLARHYSAHFERSADGRRARIAQASVGARLDSQAIRSLDSMGGVFRASAPGGPSGTTVPAPMTRDTWRALVISSGLSQPGTLFASGALRNAQRDLERGESKPDIVEGLRRSVEELRQLPVDEIEVGDRTEVDRDSLRDRRDSDARRLEELADTMDALEASADEPAATHIISNREVAQLAMTMRTAHGMEHGEAIAYAQRLLLERNPGAGFETEPKPGALDGGIARPTRPTPPPPNPDGLGALDERDLRDLASEYGVVNPSFRTRDALKTKLRTMGVASPSVRQRRSLERQAARAAVSARTVVPPPGPAPVDRVQGRRPSAGLRISLALQDWSFGNGPDDPLAGKFTRAQLRAEAVARGIDVRRNATDAEISVALREETRQNYRARQAAIPGLPPVADLMRNPDPAAVRAVFEGDYGGMTVSVVHIGRDGARGLSVQGKITDSQGRHVGSFHRRYSQGAGGAIVAHHEFLQISGQVQGSGFSNAWNGHLIQWYRQHGVKEVRVHADIDVGGYAWARLGYDFAERRTATQIMDRLHAFVTEIERRGDAATRFAGSPDPAAQLREARALLARADRHPFGSAQYPTPYELSQLGRWEGAGRMDTWIGKLALLQSDWYGVLRL